MVYCEMLGYEAPFGYLKAIEVSVFCMVNGSFAPTPI